MFLMNLYEYQAKELFRAAGLPVNAAGSQAARKESEDWPKNTALVSL